MEAIIVYYFKKIFLTFLLIQVSSIFSMENSLSSSHPDAEDLPEIVLSRWIKDFMPSFEKTKDPKMTEFYTKSLAKYRIFEADISTLFYNIPNASLAGINYAMTFEEMKEQIEQKFKALEDSGLIITPSEFEKIKDEYYPLKRENLTRIWCADYLKKNFHEQLPLKDKYDVPDYIIVLNNDEQVKIKLRWYFSDLYPLAASLIDASIYFKNIKGKKCAYSEGEIMWEEIGPETQIGFRDFSDPGNIIREEGTGKYYIVDTEIKSFKFPIKVKLRKKLEYARTRFKYLNNKVLYEQSEIDLKSSIADQNKKQNSNFCIIF